MFLSRAVFYSIGLFIMSLGVVLTIKANVGAGAWDALNVGLSEIIGLTVGTWVILVGLVLIVINAFLLKSRPELLAILTIMVIGFFIDFWLYFVLGTLDVQGIYLRYTTFIIGLIIIAIGASIYLQAKFPLSPIDGFMMAIMKHLKVKLMTAKTIGEVVALLFALIVKGPIGVGTILITFLIGPLIQFFFPFFERLMKKINVVN